MNNLQQTLESFLATQKVEVSILGFLINMFLAAILSFILGRIYVKYGNSLSNRTMFARNFVLITMTTMLIITVVKSSLALSLGLVGALSIVRFRAAIKEPGELAYIFLTIALGLGLGADQREITIIAFFTIIGVIWIKNYSYKSGENQNLYITVSSSNPEVTGLGSIVEILKKHCSDVSLKRFDESKEMIESTFLVEFDGFKELEASKSELQKLSDSVKITYLDNKGIGGIS